LCHLTFAQKPGGKMEIEEADEHFSHKNYIMAIPIYRYFVKKEPDNLKARYRLAYCLVHTRINRPEAIPVLEKLVKEKEGANNLDYWMLLAKAYFLNNEIEKAEKAYNKCLELKPGKSDEKFIRRQLKYVANAKDLMSKPVNVTFYNLGPNINSDEPDYYPFVNANETFLVFTSRRKDNVGGRKQETDGYRNSDIYFSKVENGTWSKAINAGRMINTSFDEQAVSLNADGTQMVVYIDHIEKFGDLYLTARKDMQSDFPKYKPLDEPINKEIELTGCLSEDGLTFFFSRKEKLDEQSDLYMVRKLPNGKWGLPYKLPSNINTDENEDFPFLAPDGVTLYFSSEGHNSMGSYDLFKTTWNPENNTFTDPVNLGYPINTTDEDRTISVTPDNRVGYISAYRPDGLGDLDIYRIRFNDQDQIHRIFLGKIFYEDTLSSHQPSTYNCLIIAKNMSTKEEYQFNAHTKNGKFVMALPAGVYEISVISNGYKTIKEKLTVNDVGKIEMEKNKNYILTKE
jgi:hypothetical protein